MLRKSIIIIIIDYTLNNFTTHVTIYNNRSWKMEELKKIENEKKICNLLSFIFCFVNVETDPRLRYAPDNLFFHYTRKISASLYNVIKNW